MRVGFAFTTQGERPVVCGCAMAISGPRCRVWIALCFVRRAGLDRALGVDDLERDALMRRSIG